MNKKNTPTEWVSDIVDWRKMNPKSCDLILSQASSLLNDTVDTAKSITNRADKIMALIIPAATALVVYFLNSHSKKDFLSITAILCFIVLFTSGIFCYKNWKYYTIDVVGEYPKWLFSQQFIDDGFKSEEQYVYMAYNVCRSMQSKIDVNTYENGIRMANNTTSLNILLWGLPICPIVSYFLYYLSVNYF